MHKKNEREKQQTIESFEKFQKLVSLALSEEDDEPTEEARNAAVKAIEMISDESGDLIVLPRAEVERIKTVQGDQKQQLVKVKEAKNEGMLVGGFIGLMLAKTGLLK